MEFCVRLAPQGWKEKHLDNPADAERTPAEKPECGVEKKAEKSTWARLHAPGSSRKSMGPIRLSVPPVVRR